MIVTNGYHLDAPTAQMLVDRHVTVAQITLEGGRDDHNARRALLSGRGTFDRILTNIGEVLARTSLRITVRVNIDARNAGGVDALLDHLASLGLTLDGGFSIYFAPVEAITAECHSVAADCLSKRAYAELETALQAKAFDLGLASLPYPQRFRGLCAAIRPNSFVLLANGDVHKCWDTVSDRQKRVGTVFDLAPLLDNVDSQEWLAWSPFEHPVCRECKLLPVCAGSCAHKFVNARDTLGEAASLPCPTWKYHVKERMLARAVKGKHLRVGDWEPEHAPTDPQELCAMTHAELNGRGTEPSSVVRT